MEKAGALGVRLAGRLTAELVLRSPQYMSCCKDYELDLRGSSPPPPLPTSTLGRPLPHLGRLNANLLRHSRLCSHEETASQTHWLTPAGNKLSAVENLGVTEVR